MSVINKIQATANAKDTIDYGTNVVGGVSPGKGGREHLNLPVFDTVRAAKEALNPQATSVFVPAAHAAGAIIEAIEAEIPLVVSVAEHIPVHDMIRVHEVLRTQSKTRLVGPNCPGIIAPEQCRLGIMPFRQYKKGCVGIVSKSGTLSYEAVGATTQVGLGQSIVVSSFWIPCKSSGLIFPRKLGRHGRRYAARYALPLTSLDSTIDGAVVGTTLVDGLKLFFDHPETEGIIVIGEIGGEAELNAAELIKDYKRRTKNPKPIVAMVAGRTAPEGKTMGHAGALLSPRDVTAETKAKALEEAGAVVVPHPGLMGSELKKLLGR